MVWDGYLKSRQLGKSLLQAMNASSFWFIFALWTECSYFFYRYDDEGSMIGWARF